MRAQSRSSASATYRPSTARIRSLISKARSAWAVVATTSSWRSVMPSVNSILCGAQVKDSGAVQARER